MMLSPVTHGRAVNQTSTSTRVCCSSAALSGPFCHLVVTSVHGGSTAWTLPEQLVRARVAPVICKELTAAPGFSQDGGRMVQADFSRSWIFSGYFLFTKILIQCRSKPGISPAVTLPIDGAPPRPPLWGIALPQLRRNRLGLTLFWQNGTMPMFGWLMLRAHSLPEVTIPWSLGFTYGVSPWKHAIAVLTWPVYVLAFGLERYSGTDWCTFITRHCSTLSLKVILYFFPRTMLKVTDLAWFENSSWRLARNFLVFLVNISNF